MTETKRKIFTYISNKHVADMIMQTLFVILHRKYTISLYQWLKNRISCRFS